MGNDPVEPQSSHEKTYREGQVDEKLNHIKEQLDGMAQFLYNELPCAKQGEELASLKTSFRIVYSMMAGLALILVGAIVHFFTSGRGLK